MRAVLIALLLASSFPLLPSATAHQCSTGSSSSNDCVCPAPDDGQAHQHATASGACQGFAGASQSATPGGASQNIPAPTLGALLAALAFVAVALRRTK